MDKVEFKAALSAMGVGVKDDAALAALFTKVTNGGKAVALEQWIAHLSELKTDKVRQPQAHTHTRGSKRRLLFHARVSDAFARCFVCALCVCRTRPSS